MKRAAASTPAGPVDPIFAAIAEHQRLYDWANERGIGDDEDEVDHRATTEEAYLQELVDMQPTTLAGALALLTHVAQKEEAFVDRDTPIMRAIVSVRAGLQSPLLAGGGANV